MPLFRFKRKESQPASKAKQESDVPNGKPATPQKPRWDTTWNSNTVVPEEVQELVHACTAEMKSRAEALNTPFLLLPFRPNSDAGGARTFIRSYYKANQEGSSQYSGEGLRRELRLVEPTALCSIVKWCWSRMPGGVVTWPVYEGFQLGERESKMARHAFDTFIPISAGSEARKRIIFDFFDLLSAVAAHGKMNGLGGRKLSRLAGWWAFEHSDNDKGFEGGYGSWTKAADAASHLFFAYLRSLSPEADPALSVIERIPRSLQALLGSTEYPPETPTLMQRSTPRVVMLVDSVSPGPFALLRRAKHFEYRDRDRVLREYSEFEDPVDALTDECKRVLSEIATVNSSQPLSRQGEPKTGQESWSAFQNLGFSDLDERVMSPNTSESVNGSAKSPSQGLRSQPRSRNVDHARPTTPSWADFLSSGFADDDSTTAPATLSLPSENMLPPISSRAQTPYTQSSDDNLAPGELAAVTNVDLDDAFWWVWMTSLAGEESSERKGAFGRCALIETSIMNGRWLIMEEQVKGASPDPVEAYEIVPQKKSIFSFTKRGRAKRTKSDKPPLEPSPELERVKSDTPSTKQGLAPDQQSKIKAAAAALARNESDRDVDSSAPARRGRHEDAMSTKTSSMLTLGLTNEASPAMKWAHAYDKDAIRAHYLGDSFAGRGKSRENLFSTSSVNLVGDQASSIIKPDGHTLSPASTNVPAGKPAERDLPAPPNEAQTTAGADRPSEPPVSPLEETQVAGEPPSPLPPAINVQPDDTPEVQEEPAHVPVPEPNHHAPAGGLKNESGVQASKTPQHKVERKPVPRTDNISEHPAFRQQAPGEAAAASAAAMPSSSSAEPQSPQSVTSPAAVAALRAMEAQPSSQESNKLKKQAGGGGFKKFFGRKKENPDRNSLDGPPASKGLAPPSETNLGRRLSLMRRKSNKPTPTSSQIAVAQPPPETFSEPTMPDSPGKYEQPTNEMGRIDTRSDADAKDEFARFDQGPMDDMPSVEPTESDTDDSQAPASEQHYNTQLAGRIAPDRQETGSDAFATPMERPSPLSDGESETTMEEPQPVEPEKNRWAQIRENAAKRAARASEDQARPSEDHSMQSRPSHAQSTRETDDGETSGEETIESRVARIKARVAELTGNADGAAPGAVPK